MLFRSSSASSISYVDAALDEADDLGIGWAWWQWRESRWWGMVDRAGQLVNKDDLRHIARPYVIAAPAGVRPSRGDGVRGDLTIQVNAGHADQPIVVGWSALTLKAPVVTGTCLASSQWDAIAGRLTLQVDSGKGCQLMLRTA